MCVCDWYLYRDVKYCVSQMHRCFTCWLLSTTIPLAGVGFWANQYHQLSCWHKTLSNVKAFPWAVSLGWSLLPSRNTAIYWLTVMILLATTWKNQTAYSQWDPNLNENVLQVLKCVNLLVLSTERFSAFSEMDIWSDVSNKYQCYWLYWC